MTVLVAARGDEAMAVDADGAVHKPSVYPTLPTETPAASAASAPADPECKFSHNIGMFYNSMSLFSNNVIQWTKNQIVIVFQEKF